MQRRFDPAGGATQLCTAALLISLTFGYTLALSTPTQAATEGTTNPLLAPNSEPGLTRETAIPMPAYKSTVEGIQAERAYINKFYPGWEKGMAGLVDEDGRKYDVITIIGPKGETKQLYFDITNWFGAVMFPPE
jgi:hypothetical protein